VNFEFAASGAPSAFCSAGAAGAAAGGAGAAACAVFAGADGAYKYAIGHADGDLRALTKTLNAALSGRGGGKPNFVQGSLSASRAEIEAFFNA